MPAVSVLMVFHRDTPFLRPAIASVLTQTWRDLELILVDNGTGLTAAALGDWGRDGRLRWVRLAANEGIAVGHNAGVAAARGEFIALLDYDDLALPTRLERQVGALRDDPGLGLVSSRATRIDEHGRTTGTVFCLPDPRDHRVYAQYAAPVITPAAMGRRGLFAALPYRPEFPFAADLDFQARATEHWRMAVLPEPLLQYRWYDAQTTQQRGAAIERSRCIINLVTARRRADRPENLPAAVRWLEEMTPGEACRRTAGACVAEGFSVLAGFYARRLFAVERTPDAMFRSLALLARTLPRASRKEMSLVTRMYLTGPVRALGLRPA